MKEQYLVLSLFVLKGVLNVNRTYTQYEHGSLINASSVPCTLCAADDDSKNSSKSAKKQRVETFQQKEKRKRDMGQATSDKTFVEEEKRILRQNVD